MQTLQQPQPAQQQQQENMKLQPPNQLLHLNMPIESTAAFMENGLITPTTSIIPNGYISSKHSPSCSSPPSPPSSSTSSISSSESSTTQATPSLGVNLRVTGQCSQGGRKYMEDYFSVAYQHSENAKDLEYAFFGIFDGHGGAEAATFAKEHLMMQIINQKLFWSDTDEDVLRAIREGYIATHFAMWREQDKWPNTANGLPSTAGTTATVAFIRHEKIYIGHVGDSGIVLGYQNEGEKCWRAKQLTIDHKPESMAERARIMRSGGKVVVKSGVPRVVWNRPRNVSHRGPILHNTPIDEIPFLAVARSLGDLWSYNSLCNEFVVSPDPDVRVIKINPKTFRCLIFGTDGLWNVVTPQEAVNTVFHNESVNERLQRQRGENLSNENGWMNPSKVLVDRALGTWSSKKMRADNTSVVTVILHPPNTNTNGCSSNKNNMGNISNSSKLEGCLRENFGLEYTQLNSDQTITYREIAEKYLPPEEYRNFNYYEEDSVAECNGNKSYYDERYAKLTVNSQRFFYIGGNKEQQERIAMCGIKNIAKGNSSVPVERGIHLFPADDNADDDLDEEEFDDDECEDGNADDIVAHAENETTDASSHQRDVLVSNNYVQHYMRDQKLESIDSFNVNANDGGGSEEDETTTGSYMSTFVESYNTLLGGDSNVGSDAEITADVSTSSSSSSYKSHSAICMQELVQEQQLYQQQCMSEEEGYSLTKLETRREQQRCSATGVQTFRIFQQQQQQQEQEQKQQQDEQQQQEQQKGQIDNDDTLVHAPKTPSPNPQITSQQNYMWEPRFPSAFSGNQNYPDQQSQLLLEQQLKSLELNSLLQQEREEERQVELERQMEIERFQKQQQQQQQSRPSHLEQNKQSKDSDKPTVMATSDFLLVHGNDNASSEVLASTTNSSNEETDADITIDEEYLLFDEEEDASVQIHEISSSSSSSSSSTSSSCFLLEDGVPVKSNRTTSGSSRETRFGYTSDPTSVPSSSSSYIKGIEVGKEPPKMIEKLEKIEILHDKPELVIETTPVSTISTRSKQNKTNMTPSGVAPTTNRRRYIKTNATTRLHYPNVPNENQHQTKSCRATQKNGILHQLTPVPIVDSQILYSKRQLRSTSSGSNSNSNTANNNPCNISSSNRSKATCFHTQNSLNNGIDYIKRTLRTRNSLTKDLKAKTTLLSSSIKRTSSSSAMTTRFLRTQAVNLLNLHQSPQVLASNCKKTTSSSSSQALISPACTIRRTNQQQQQPQQRPLSTTSFNFINLRSRQIGSSATNNNISNFPEQQKQQRRQQQQSSSTSGPISTRKSILNVTTSNNTPSNAITNNPTTQNYVRRNLRSLSAVRACMNGKVSVSTSTTGLTNYYCKSMRSLQSASLVTPPPPSPKHLKPSVTNCTFAVTRARTANFIMSAPSTTNSHMLNNAIGLSNNRKRNIESNEPILMSSRTPKRLRR